MQMTNLHNVLKHNTRITTRNVRISDEIILFPKDKFCRKNKFLTKIFLFKGNRLILDAKSFCNKKNVLLPIAYSDFFFFFFCLQ